jgi:hypothetical protein
MPLAPNEGPVGLVVCPSRELARQTHEVVNEFVDACNQSGKYNQMRTMLCMGGVDSKLQCEVQPCFFLFPPLRPEVCFLTLEDLLPNMQAAASRLARLPS